MGPPLAGRGRARAARPLQSAAHDTALHPATTEAQVCRLRRDRKLGPARIGPVLGLPASTVHRILARYGLNRLAFVDRPTGTVIRRYERERPGELIHVDVKKLGRIPGGGGHKVLGRQAARARRSNRHAASLLVAVAAVLTVVLVLAAAFASTAATRMAARHTFDLLLRLVPWYTPRR